MNKARLEAFSDGVFAIVITLLVLDLRVPHSDDAQLSTALRSVAPQFAVYVMSFALIGVYWVAHHMFFTFITHVDRNVLWLNLLSLLAVSVLPIPTSILGQHYRSPVAVALYGVDLAACNLSGCALWIYATNRRRLVSQQLPAWFVRFVLLVHGAPVAVYGAAVLIGATEPLISLALFAAVPAFFILPNPLISRPVERARTTIG